MTAPPEANHPPSTCLTHVRAYIQLPSAASVHHNTCLTQDNTLLHTYCTYIHRCIQQYKHNTCLPHKNCKNVQLRKCVNTQWCACFIQEWVNSTNASCSGSEEHGCQLRVRIFIRGYKVESAQPCCAARVLGSFTSLLICGAITRGAEG